MGIPDIADRGIDACLSQSLGVSDRQILTAAVAVVDQPVSLGRRPLADGLVQGVEDEAGRHRCRDAPTDDFPGEDVDDKGDIHHALQVET